MRRPLLMAVLLGGMVVWSPGALGERYTVPLLVPAGTSGGPQGVLRILNGTDEAGAVEIYAIDDAGARSGPATFTLNASAAAEFSASDLASGNAMKGLTGSVGSLSGDARLEIDTDLEIVPAAYVRAADGTMSTMHETVRGRATSGGGYEYLVPIFNPSTETTQVSRLRLINPGDAAAAIAIGAIDDSGAAATGGGVTLTLAAGGAQTLTAQQLEAGHTAIAGRLGAGTGKWRLSVSSDGPIQVLNLVSSTSGYVNNLSTTAVAGSAPTDHEVFSERIADAVIEYRTDSGDFTFTAGAGDRFTETGESGGMTVSSTGSYAYEAIGPDAGRLTLSYDDGDACEANLYFSSPIDGWFALFCTGTDDPDGYWVGGNWSVVDEDGDGGGDPVTTAYGVDEALPGVPTSGLFVPAVLSGGSVSSTADGTTITLNDGGHFELNDGTRYTCAAAGGCAVANGTVTRGTVTGTAAGGGEVDRFPTFRNATAPGNQSYTVGTAIAALILPAASGGDGTLSYSLSPAVPGLTFDAATRQLSGTPSTANTYAMTYTVTDEDGDTDSIGFTITVGDGTTEAGSLGMCQVGMMLSSGQSCTYPGTTDAFSVNARGRGSFLGRLAGIRIRINNETIDGRVYDFQASHQGDGVWRIDRIAGSTEPPTNGGGTGTDTSPSFPAGSGPGNQTYTAGTPIATLTLPEANGGNGTLTYALTPEVAGLSFNDSTRQLTGTPTTAGVYTMTYTATDEDGASDMLSFTVTVEDVGTGDPVMIPDAVLRSAIEAQLGKSQGAPIYKAEMQSLKTLDPGWLNEIGGIRNLAGLQFATNLEELTLRSNHHTVFPTPDLSPLAGLTKLTRLDLGAINNIENPSPLDLAPLAGLVNLSWLELGHNHISDISALKGLTKLAWMSIRDNDISNIAALSDMPVLEQLYGQDNAIAHIDSLRGLTELQTVVLSSNEITDLAPLAANPGLASGDLVDVRNNPLSIASTGTHVPSLRARGVNVRFSEIVKFNGPQTYKDNVFVIPVVERISEINDHLNEYVDRVHERFGDVFDFVIFVPNRNMPPAYFAIRQNSVTGIGRTVLQTGGKLQGVINMGGTSVVSSDLADRGVSIIRVGPLLHEIMHRWANFVVPSSYGSHWGFSSANGVLGGFDIADLVDHGGGRYSAGHVSVAGSAANSIPYAPIELYLAGLIPPEDVPDIWVARDGAFLYGDDGAPVYDDSGYPIFAANHVSTYTIEDIVAEHGARVPESTNSQRAFRAVVVLLVNEENPATRELLDVVSRDVAWFGNDENDEFPSIFNFHEATGGRASLTVDGLDQLALDNR